MLSIIESEFVIKWDTGFRFTASTQKTSATFFQLIKKRTFTFFIRIFKEYFKRILKYLFASL